MSTLISAKSLCIQQLVQNKKTKNRFYHGKMFGEQLSVNYQWYCIKRNCLGFGSEFCDEPIKSFEKIKSSLTNLIKDFQKIASVQ